MNPTVIGLGASRLVARKPYTAPAVGALEPLGLAAGAHILPLVNSFLSSF